MSPASGVISDALFEHANGCGHVSPENRPHAPKTALHASVVSGHPYALWSVPSARSIPCAAHTAHVMCPAAWRTTASVSWCHLWTVSCARGCRACARHRANACAASLRHSTSSCGRRFLHTPPVWSPALCHIISYHIIALSVEFKFLHEKVHRITSEDDVDEGEQSLLAGTKLNKSNK